MNEGDRIDTSARFSKKVADQLAARFPETQYVANERYADEDTVVVNPDRITEVAMALKNDFPFLMDICGVDYPGRDKRFDVVYHFADPEKGNRLRVKVRVNEDEEVPSLTPVYRGANWFEREAYDMFGVRFSGHPNLRRILCHEEFVGYPLRKDYPAEKNQELPRPIDHVFAADRERMMREADDYLHERVWLNIGPAHPATHGTLRFMAVLEGETIEKMDVEIGYLHRCFEKMVEGHDYNQAIPYTDRLNYCSAPINNTAWCRTIEKLIGVTVPPRAQIMRLILDEFARIIDHFVCIGTGAVDLGGLTNFWLGFTAREKVYDLFEKLCGARLTVSLARIGGMGFDLPEGWVQQARETLKEILAARKDLENMLLKNRIVINRLVGVGQIDTKTAIEFGYTGPCLRATGLARDLRVDAPYNGYENFKFDIPVGHRGDSYDRLLVRMEEIIQSCKIIEQALDNIPSGPISVEDPSIVLPPKNRVYGDIEGLMNQFMMVIHGVQPPAGEIYCATEGANGELGFYVVSDGSGRPYRVKCRPPCFAIFQSFPHLTEGRMVADAIAVLGTINIIAGELDR